MSDEKQPDEKAFAETMTDLGKGLLLLFGVIGAIVGVVIAMRTETKLYAVVIIFAAWAFLMGGLIYLSFFKKGATYRFIKHRDFSLIGIGILIGMLLTVPIFKTSRDYVVVAARGTYTPTPTFTSTHTPTRTVTPTVTSTINDFASTPTTEPTETPIPSTPTFTPYPTPVLLFKDEFINNQNGWELGKASKNPQNAVAWEKKILGGKLLHNIDNDSAYVTEQWNELPHLTAKDFCLDFEANITSMSNPAYTGIEIKYRSYENDYYLVRFYGDGTYRVQIVYDGTWDYLKQSTYSNHINQQAGTTNRYGLCAIGAVISIYANNQLLTQIEDGNLINSGSIAIGVIVPYENYANVEFDNVIVRESP